MKNKIYKILLPVYAVLCLLLLIGIAYVADDFPQFESKALQFFASLAICLVGVLMGNVVHWILHETAHLIPLKNKAVILEFSVLFVTFTKTENGYKKSVFKKNKYGGSVSFVGKNPDFAGALIFSSCLWAWVATLFCLIVFAVAFYISNSWLTYCLFGGATLATFYSLLLNFLSTMPSSDGSLLFNPKKHVDRIFAIAETESRLFAGESLSEMSEELFYSEQSKINLYYSYLRLMQIGDKENAKKVLDICIEENEKTLDNQPIALDLERFYLALIDEDKKVIEMLCDEVVDFCDRNVFPTTLRVMVKYRAYLGDVKWETALRATFEGQSKNAFKGLFKTEKDIYDKFS